MFDYHFTTLIQPHHTILTIQHTKRIVGYPIDRHSQYCCSLLKYKKHTLDVVHIV